MSFSGFSYEQTVWNVKSKEYLARPCLEFGLGCLLDTGVGVPAPDYEVRRCRLTLLNPC